MKVFQYNSYSQYGKVNKNLYEYIIQKIRDIKVEFVAHMYDRVIIGKADSNNPFPDSYELERYLNMIRLFNECFELYIWRYGKDFCYRIREDGRGEPVNIYEEEHIVWGTGVENDAGGIRLIEDRVTPIKFPYRIKKGDLPIKYRIRNYFDFDRDGLIRFYDARLVEFIDRKGEKLNG